MGIGASWFGALATLFGALATLAAVLVALFKDEFCRWWRRPELNIRSEPYPPDWHVALMKSRDPVIGLQQPEYKCYFLRLWIYNTGKSPARNIEVFASRLLYQKESSEKYVKDDQFLPMNLRWAYSHEIFRDRLAPNMGRHCDLGHISDPEFKHIHEERRNGVPEDKTVLCLALEAPPNTGAHLLRPGTYKLQMLIAADNASPKKKVLKIMHTGNWFEKEEDMFREPILKIE